MFRFMMNDLGQMVVVWICECGYRTFKPSNKCRCGLFIPPLDNWQETYQFNKLEQIDGGVL